MMYRVCIAAVIVLIAAMPASAVQVGWSVDVVQNQISPYADNFHVWGVIESLPDQNGPRLPQLIGHSESTTCVPECGCGLPTCICGPLPFVGATIGGTPTPNRPAPSGYPGPWPPPSSGPYYYFEADWASNPNDPNYKIVGLNDLAHFGLTFDVNDANRGYWLQSIWTKQTETGDDYALVTTPLVGFNVSDGPGAKLTLQNATATPLTIDNMAMTALPVGTNFDINNLTSSFFDIHTEITWSPVQGPGGNVPKYLAPDSFFDVFLESVTPPGGGPSNLGNLQTGQVLLVRQQLTYQVGGQPRSFWQYELHEVSPVPEPSTIALLLVGAGTMLLAARRRMSKS